MFAFAYASAVLATLLPDCVASVVADDLAVPDALPPQEVMAMANAVPKRVHEFALGRGCARAALTRLGHPRAVIPVDLDRAPIWPFGIVGSITHCRGYVAAAVAWSRDLRGIGIDAESAEALDPSLLPFICLGSERALLARGSDVPWGKLVFSAKESIYKCVYPSSRLILEFSDVVVDMRDDGTFTATSPRVELSNVQGRWACDDHHVVTSAILRW